MSSSEPTPATLRPAPGTAGAFADDQLIPAGPKGFLAPERARWTSGYLAVLFLAQFAMGLAQLAPSVYSLAVRVQDLAPANKDSVLAVVLTIPAIAIIIVNPIVGILSDRTRSRLGRRRPWMIAGLAGGLLGLVLIGTAPGIPMVVVGWTIGYLGLTVASSLVITHLGDALPAAQRGRVSGINGAIAQIGPIVGVMLSGALVHFSFLLFFVPGLIAVAGSIAFLIRMKDPSTRGAQFGRVSVLGVFAQVVFNPKKHKDFAWVWISKAAFFVGLYMSTVYGVYFLGQRLHLNASAIAGLIALSSMLGIAMAMLGALGSGYLTDRIRRRRVLILIAGVVMAGAMIMTMFSYSAPMYVAATAISSLGVGVFGAVDQALALDVIPDQHSPGRFLAINGLANEIPKAIAPGAAALIASIGGAGHYEFIYLATAVLFIVGGLLVLPVRGVR